MDIYLLRHGIAEDLGPGAQSDAARRLTAEGRDKCVEAARGIAALRVGFDQVWTSPLIRARETAELCLPDYRAEPHDVLAGGTPEQLCAALRDLPAKAVVILVGHEPQMSGTIEYLLGSAGDHGWVAMKKAGLALVTVNLAAWPREPAELQFLLTPRQLRQLGAVGDFGS